MLLFAYYKYDFAEQVRQSIIRKTDLVSAMCLLMNARVSPITCFPAPLTEGTEENESQEAE